jgi:hypothetical protein
MNLKTKVSHKKKLIKKHRDELNKLLSTCTHENKTSQWKYYSGNYNDRAETHYWDECDICGDITNHRIVTHNWYG